MLRFLVRFLGLICLATGFVAVVLDAARSIANGIVVITPLGEAAAKIVGERYLLLQPAIERHVHPLLWDPVLLWLTRAPAAVVAIVLGAFLLWLGRRRAEPIGYRAGR